MFRSILIFFVIVNIILGDTAVTEPPGVQNLIDTIFSQPNSSVEIVIDDLFKDKTPNVTTSNLPAGVPEVDDCAGGECVAHYLCRNNTFNTDGENVIDIRFAAENQRECRDYLSVCCGAEEKLEPIPPSIPLILPEECGFRNPAGLGFRIHGVNGEAQHAEFPWMVAVLRDDVEAGKISRVYHCGGSLIHRQVVLTAAHWIAGKDAATLVARAGEWDTQTTTEVWAHQDRAVERIVSHPNFNNITLFNDVALLFVREPFLLCENVQTICLPPPNFQFDNIQCFSSGWGKTNFGQEGVYQVILKKVELQIVNGTKCQDSLRKTRLGRRFKLHPSFVCAGGEAGKDTCTGDGGSPLVCPISGTESSQYYQAGIVAWGIGCGSDNVPGVYANVAMFRNWIDLQMQGSGLNSSSYSYVPVLDDK